MDGTKPDNVGTSSSNSPQKGAAALKRPASPLQQDLEKKPKVDSVQQNPNPSPCLSAGPAKKRPASPLGNETSKKAKVEDVRQRPLICQTLFTFYFQHWVNNFIFYTLSNAFFHTMCTMKAAKLQQNSKFVCAIHLFLLTIELLKMPPFKNHP